MSKKSRTTKESLELARKEYGNFVSTRVQTATGIPEDELDSMSFDEIASAISVPQLRRDFIAHAVRLLNANIADLSPYSTPILKTKPKYTYSVINFIFPAAVGAYYASWTAAIVIGFWAAACWLTGFEYGVREEMDRVGHNGNIGSCKRTIDSWGKSIELLQALSDGAD